MTRWAVPPWLATHVVIWLHRVEIVHWVVENQHPFEVVKDCISMFNENWAIQMLLTASEYHISRHQSCFWACTQSHSKNATVEYMCHTIVDITVTMYQKYDSKLSFATNTWTSSNYQALAVSMVQIVIHRKAWLYILDVVEVAKVHRREIHITLLKLYQCQLHTGKTSAKTFANILDEFRISDKVNKLYM